MGQIQFGKFAESIRKRFQAVYDPTVSDSLVPTVVLENDRPEYSYPAADMLCMATHSIADISTDFLALGIVNPTGSNILVLIEGIWGMWTVQNTSVEHNLGAPGIYRVTSADLPDLHLIGGVRDTRWDELTGASRRGMAQIRSNPGSVAEVGLLIGRTRGISGVRGSAANVDQSTFFDVPLPRPFVLGPRAGLAVQFNHSSAADMVLDVTYAWTERAESAWEIGGSG